MTLPDPHPRLSLDHMLVNGYTLDTIERQVRRWAIARVLREEHYHHTRAAARLGVHRNTLTRMLKDLKIEPPLTGKNTRGLPPKKPAQSVSRALFVENSITR